MRGAIPRYIFVLASPSLYRRLQFHFGAGAEGAFDAQCAADLAQAILHVAKAIATTVRSVWEKSASVVSDGNHQPVTGERQSYAHFGSSGVLQHVLKCFFV